MSKTLSPGEKREKQLRYRFRQLKRSQIIPKDMTMKQFRGSEFNAFTTKKITIKNSKGKESVRVVHKMIPLKALQEAGGRYKKKTERKKAVRPDKESLKEQRRRAYLVHLLWRAQQASERKEKKRLRRLAFKEAA